MSKQLGLQLNQLPIFVTSSTPPKEEALNEYQLSISGEENQMNKSTSEPIKIRVLSASTGVCYPLSLPPDDLT